jgi:hypothetical protein
MACVAALPFVVGAGSDDSKKAATSKEIAYHTYAEQVDRVTLIVDSYPARLFQKEKYIPLQIAVGVEGKGPELAVSIDNFTLVDEADEIIAAAPDYGEYSPLQVGNRFETYHRTASRLYTPEGVGDAKIHLSRESYLIDDIYFPAPAKGLQGVLTLTFETEGMDNLVEVRFEVPLKKDKHEKHRSGKD